LAKRHPNTMSFLQEQIDLAPPEGVLKLDTLGREFQGPIVVRRPLTLEGNGVSIWAPAGPVVSIESDGVQLRKLNVEITGDSAAVDGPTGCALRVADNVKVSLSDVAVRGHAVGLAGEEGTWVYPRKLTFGGLKSGQPHEMCFTVTVPVPCTLQSHIEGVHVQPRNIPAGAPVEVAIKIEVMTTGTRLRGDLDLQSPQLVRRIALVADIVNREREDARSGAGQNVWDGSEQSTPVNPATAAGVSADSVTIHPDLWECPEAHASKPAVEPPPIVTPKPVEASPTPPPAPQPPSVKAAPAPPPMLLVVGKGEHYTTVTRAIQEAGNGATIRVKPGVYQESLLIDKHVEIIGVGPRDQIKIESIDGNCVRMHAAYAVVRGVTFRAAGRSGKERFGVCIASGELVLDDCDISGGALACVGVSGAMSSPTLRRCKIHDSKSAGILLFNHAQALIEDCEIFANGHAGIAVRQGADPVVRRCAIHHGKQAGVMVHDRGRGAFEDCDIHANALANVEISDGGNPQFRNTKIRDGEFPGVCIHKKGAGTFDDCEISKNARAGVEIKQPSKPTFRRCKIIYNKQAGILFADQALGLFEECQIVSNARLGVEIRAFSDPTLRKCKIHGNHQIGVVCHDRAQGTLEDCVISQNRRSGVHISRESKPILRRCQVSENRHAGVIVQQSSAGAIESCQISENVWAGVAILSEANPILRKCKIRDGKHAGLLVVDEGAGTIEDCDITDNALMGVAIAKQGNPMLRQCNIKRNKGVGLWAFQHAAGALEECELLNNLGGAQSIAHGCKVQMIDNTTS